MLKKKTILNISFLIAISCNVLHGQTPDYITRQKTIQLQVERLSHINDSIFKHSLNFVIGKSYYSGGNKYVHPFFGDNLWVPAEIFSSGESFKVDLAKYDLSLDYIVILYNFESLSYPIYLNKETVREFAISGHHFKYIDGLTGSGIDELVPGYYEEFYTGKTRFLIRRLKLKKYDNANLSEIYSDRIYLFILKEGKYFLITSQKSLFKVLSDHKKELKNFMKNNNIRFSHGNYEQVGKLLEYYDTL